MLRYQAQGERIFQKWKYYILAFIFSQNTFNGSSRSKMLVKWPYWYAVIYWRQQQRWSGYWDRLAFSEICYHFYIMYNKAARYLWRLDPLNETENCVISQQHWGLNYICRLDSDIETAFWDSLCSVWIKRIAEQVAGNVGLKVAVSITALAMNRLHCISVSLCAGTTMDKVLQR